MTTTVVTAFYPLQKSKHAIEQYNEWINHFCKFNCNLVVYTNDEYAALINKSRNPVNTKIFVKSFDSYVMTTPEMMAMWNRHHAFDPEANIHSPELYAVWAIKQESVMLAIQDNPFNSIYFVWCDIGIQRNASHEELYSTFPSNLKQLCDSGRITILEIDNIPDSYYSNWINKQPIQYPLPNKAIAAGCMAGDISAWKNFSEEYVKMVHELDAKNIFNGKEQNVYLTLLLSNKLKQPFKLLLPSSVGGDPWMSMPIILGGKAPAIFDNRFELSNKLQKSIIPIFMGGLGNQLFQAAVGYAYSKKYDRKLTLCNTSIGGHRKDVYYSTVMYNLQQFIGEHKDGIIWRESGFSYKEIPSDKDILYGYFQSSKYFNDVSGEIRTLFDPNPVVKNVVSQKYADLLASPEAKVVVHVRRTDFLVGGNQPIHAVTTNNYYKDAIIRIKQKVVNPEFIVFSDDLSWCREQEFFSGATFVDETTDYLALHLMSQFKYYIIPNSTFAWWAVWLGTPAETVIVPDRWFGPNGPQDYHDIYEPDWIRIPSV